MITLAGKAEDTNTHEEARLTYILADAGREFMSEFDEEVVWEVDDRRKINAVQCDWFCRGLEVVVGRSSTGLKSQSSSTSLALWVGLKGRPNRPAPRTCTPI